MPRYRVVRGKPEVFYDSDVDYDRARDLQYTFDLNHLSLETIWRKWDKYSDSMRAGWMIPDKQSVEQVFGVELEEEKEE